nr:metalloregulator ArsR/SmtB family transcription factor [Oceanobacter mangrovi]
MKNAMTPLELFKLLADETRLTTLMLIQRYGELCVCELTEALLLSQPKVSRHLALLRKAGLLLDEKRGQWVYYSLNPALETGTWAVLEQLSVHHQGYIAEAVERMSACQPKESLPGCCQPRPNASF